MRIIKELAEFFGEAVRMVIVVFTVLAVELAIAVLIGAKVCLPWMDTCISTGI